jgi:gluconolactonase
MASALQAAEVAWNQGVDIYGENRARYGATMELMALQMTSGSMQGICANDGTSAELFDTWSIGYNHYHGRMGMTLPHTAALLAGPIPERGRSDWNIFHERLTHYGIVTPTVSHPAAKLAFEPMDPAFTQLIASSAVAETLATGFRWSEGPVWIPDAGTAGGGFLLFSDVPANIAYRWDAASGVSEFLNPSGGRADLGLREPGTNGLIPAATAGAIIAADHGNRAIVQIELASRTRTTLADRFDGKRLSSPNDVVLAKSGDLYFTDPPYAFVKGDASPLKEQQVNGVYRRAPGGRLTLIDGSLARPNGIALSPDETRLYVANSDPAHAVWMVYDRAADGSISNGRILNDVTARVGEANPGLPDGLKPDINGNLFATGPGGVYVLAPDGREIGLIRVDGAVANVAFGGPAFDTLYLTSGSRLIRLPTLTRGFQVGR